MHQKFEMELRFLYCIIQGITRQTRR